MLLGLTGFAISQPLLSVLGDDPTTLALHDIEGLSLLLFALLVAVVPPVVLWALVTGVGMINRPAGRALYLLAVTGLVACFVVQVLKSAGLERPLVLAVISLAAGVAFARHPHPPRRRSPPGRPTPRSSPCSRSRSSPSPRPRPRC